MSEGKIIGKQKLTSNGKWGAAMVIIAPFISTFCSIGASVEMSKSYGEPAGYLLGAGLSAAAFLFGCVMVVVGREMTFARVADNPSE